MGAMRVFDIMMIFLAGSLLGIAFQEWQPHFLQKGVKKGVEKGVYQTYKVDGESVNWVLYKQACKNVLKLRQVRGYITSKRNYYNHKLELHLQLAKPQKRGKVEHFNCFLLKQSIKSCNVFVFYQSFFDKC